MLGDPFGPGQAWGAAAIVAGIALSTWPRRRLAEADGNRTRLAEVLGHVGFEDREGHQAPIRLRARA